MLVDPAITDGLESLEGFDLTGFSLPLLSAAPSGDEDDKEEDDEESGDDTDESEEDSESDSDDSDEDDEEEDDKTRSLIKQLREENKSRRLRLRAITKERDALKAENARLKRAKGSPRRKEAEEADDDEDDTDPSKLTPREEAAEIKSALVDVMQDLDLGKKYRRIIAALVDPDELDIEVSDTGKVTVSGLKEAVEELLEDYPEWQNKAAEEEGGSKFQGSSTGNRKKRSGNGLDKASLAKKYPALAGR